MEIELISVRKQSLYHAVQMELSFSPTSTFTSYHRGPTDDERYGKNTKYLSTV